MGGFDIVQRIAYVDVRLGGRAEPGAGVQQRLRARLLVRQRVAGDDDAATGVLLALRQAGLRVPEDIAVVGFDDLAYARLFVPSLTTVRAPIETAGLLAARQLISLIQTGAAELHTLLPTEPVIRQSCGCP